MGPLVLPSTYLHVTDGALLRWPLIHNRLFADSEDLHTVYFKMKPKGYAWAWANSQQLYTLYS